tara:strand:- start:808 stop:1035 length:228 start_codon:yes stop_codon:yes gene_type:complete
MIEIAICKSMGFTTGIDDEDVIMGRHFGYVKTYAEMDAIRTKFREEGKPVKGVGPLKSGRYKGMYKIIWNKRFWE